MWCQMNTREAAEAATRDTLAGWLLGVLSTLGYTVTDDGTYLRGRDVIPVSFIASDVSAYIAELRHKKAAVPELRKGAIQDQLKVMAQRRRELSVSVGLPIKPVADMDFSALPPRENWQQIAPMQTLKNYVAARKIVPGFVPIPWRLFRYDYNGFCRHHYARPLGHYPMIQWMSKWGFIVRNLKCEENVFPGKVVWILCDRNYFLTERALLAIRNRYLAGNSSNLHEPPDASLTSEKLLDLEDEPDDRAADDRKGDDAGDG